MTAEEQAKMDELWAGYIEELEERKAHMIDAINKMGVDELELMLKKFDEFEMDLFINGGVVD